MIPKDRRFVIAFPGGRAAFAVHVSRRTPPRQIASLLGFHEPRPTIYMAGGAGGMSPEDVIATQAVVEHGLARFADENDAVVIDGGTEAGIGTMMGEARRKNRYSFPLIGIAPLERVCFPGHDSEDGAPLNHGHSHFILTTGDDFGDESATITRMTHVLSGEGAAPALGILINGGRISRDEVYVRTTSSQMSFPLVVIEGTGRFADVLARAFYAGHAEEEDLKAILRKGRLLVVSVSDGPNELRAKLTALFRLHQRTAAQS